MVFFSLIMVYFAYQLAFVDQKFRFSDEFYKIAATLCVICLIIAYF